MIYLLSLLAAATWAIAALLSLAAVAARLAAKMTAPSRANPVRATSTSTAPAGMDAKLAI
jgi:hypothetical protein